VVRSLALIGVAVSVGLLGARVASGGPAPAVDEAEAEAEAPASALAFDVALRALGAYYDRGFLQERRGFVFQPEVEVAFTFADEAGWSAAAVAGVFASIHEHATGIAEPEGAIDGWYEVAWWAGFCFEAEGFSVSPYFQAADSPSGAFGHYEEFVIEVAYDDRGWAGRFSLQPSLALVLETFGALDEQSRGLYLGLGLEPTLVVPCACVGEVTLRAPVEVGLSVARYYEDEAGEDHRFGYATLGAFADVPLRSLPGEPALEIGVRHAWFGEALEVSNERDEDTVVSIGLVVSF